METYSGQRLATQMADEEKAAAHRRWQSGELDAERAERSVQFIRATQKKGAPMTYGTGKPPA